MGNNKLLFIVNVDWFFISHRLPIALKALEEGYEVHLACAFSNKKEELKRLGIQCHDIAFSRSGYSLREELSVIVNIRKLIKKINPDIVHAVTIKPVLYSGFVLQSIMHPPALVAAISGLGYVFTANTIRAKLTRLIVFLLYKFALRGKRKKVIFQNSSDQKILSDIVNLTEIDRTLIKGSGADLSIYQYKLEPQTKIKVISMACRLLKEKGVLQFVDAARIITTRFPDVEFWLIGNVDPENPNSITAEEVDSWVEEGVIIALGHRDDIPKLFAESHIITMPSFYGEGVPKVLIEAAACGRPIVTTDNPGCRESVIDKKTGLIVPIKDSVAIADAISILLMNNQMRIDMGARARDYAVNEFDVNNVVEKHIEIYKSLMVNKQ
ncbi:glycosyltransferase family 4 protein [Aliivibrio sifiae]|uniref:glycosyltransferase family 4 protein n=1 Tax=Aliivibrio sifiae TaxID=566293 RepID=UPI003D11FEFC